LAVRVAYPPSVEWAEDFLALAEAASHVRHPMLARVEAFGRLEDGACYVGTELVPGETLDTWADGVGIPPLPQVVDLLRRLCVGLQTAARAGVAHDGLNLRNIRVLRSAPSNDTGLRLPVKVLDLGVMAACFEEPRDLRALRFMAPEQLAVRNDVEARRQGLDTPDALIDDTFRCSAAMNVFSCGSLLYHLATGGPPFAGTSARELLVSQSAGRLVPPLRINPQISAAMNAVILRALAYDPAERFDNVAELGEALGRLDSVLPPAPPTPEWLDNSPGRDGRRDSREQRAVTLDSTLDRDGRHDSREQRAVTPHNDQDADLLDGSPTFKANDILALLRESRGDDETPTVAPPPTAAPVDPHESVSGVSPIALLSSAPPYERRSARPRATTPAAPLQPWPDTLGDPGSAIVIVDEEPAPAPVRTSVPHTPVAASTRPRTRRRMATWTWLLPLAAAASAFAFLGVRSVTNPSVPLPEHPASVVDDEPRQRVVRTPHSDDEPSEPREPEQEPSALPSSETPRTGAVDQNDPTPSAMQRIAPARTRERAHTRGPSEPAAARNSGSGSAAQTSATTSSLELEHNAPDAAASSADARVDDVVAVAALPSSGTPTPPTGNKVVEAPSPAPVPSSGARPAPAGHPLSATVDVGSYTVRGSLPAAPVRRAAERLRGAFANCYKAAAQAAGHNAFGESIVEVRIDERGRASSPRVHGGQLPRLDACIADAVAKLVCEKAPDTGTVLASWKVTFGP
jgi:serine/threonine-protein kinase